jgi:hypothetical protein
MVRISHRWIVPVRSRGAKVPDGLGRRAEVPAKLLSDGSGRPTRRSRSQPMCFETKPPMSPGANAHRSRPIRPAPNKAMESLVTNNSRARKRLLTTMPVLCARVNNAKRVFATRYCYCCEPNSGPENEMVSNPSQPNWEPTREVRFRPDFVQRSFRSTYCVGCFANPTRMPPLRSIARRSRSCCFVVGSLRFERSKRRFGSADWLPRSEWGSTVCDWASERVVPIGYQAKRNQSLAWEGLPILGAIADSTWAPT